MRNLCNRAIGIRGCSWALVLLPPTPQSRAEQSRQTEADRQTAQTDSFFFISFALAIPQSPIHALSFFLALSLSLSLFSTLLSPLPCNHLLLMAPVKTRSTSSRHRNDRGYKADPEDTNDDDDFYGMRELKHQLAGMNLQLKDTMGDGNCLFRACADQFTGSEREHAALRAEVCRYIEDHEEHFKSFLDNETVQAHVAQMRKNGTYGGNIELVAFARMKRVDIKVYQPGYIFVIEGIDVKKEGSSPGQRPVMHIA